MARAAVGLTKLAKNCGSLKSLSFANSSRLTDNTLTEFLRHCSALTSLSLQGCDSRSTVPVDLTFTLAREQLARVSMVAVDHQLR